MVFLKEGCTHCACRYFKQPLAQTSTYSLPHWHSLAMPAEVQGGQPLGQHASQQAVWLSSCSVLTTTPTACEKPQPSSCWKNRWAHLSIRLLYFFLPGQVKYGERCAKKKGEYFFSRKKHLRRHLCCIKLACSPSLHSTSYSWQVFVWHQS